MNNVFIGLDDKKRPYLPNLKTKHKSRSKFARLWDTRKR
jgi:hypothetical protein